MKKRLLLQAAVCLLFAQAPAQNLQKLEWFFDNLDPGFGNADAGHTVALSGADATVDVVADATGLAVGFHYFNVRTQDENGHWSATARRVLYIPGAGGGNPAAANLQKLEWFFDSNDPGIGLADAGHTSALSGTEATIDVTADVTALAVGFHYFNVRSMDANGKWSATARRVIYKPAAGGGNPAAPNLSKLEWFFDSNDPGIGLADVSHTITLSNPDEVFDVTASVTGLAAGFHYFNCRSMDVNGHWSATARRVIYIPAAGGGNPAAPNLSKLEWFFDSNDPGIGLADAGHTASLSGNDATIDVTADVTALAIGFHYFNTRTMDVNGHWSATARRVIYKPESTTTVPPPNITAMEYFWDGFDPGFGLATAVSGFTPATDIANFMFDVCVSGLNAGSHTFHVRSKDANGRWSETAPRTITLDASTCADVSNCTIDYGDPANCGTCFHAPAQPAVPGISGKSVNLDGINQHISTPTGVLNGTGPFTVELWVRSSESRVVTNFLNRKTILGNATTGSGSGDLSIYLENGHPGFWTGLSGSTDFSFTSAGRTFADNAWHHVALQRSSTGVLSFYVDGLLEKSQPGFLNALATTSFPLKIGGQNGTDRNAGCQVDEVRFSSAARYSGQFFTPPTAPFSSDANTKILYHLDEASGVTATDASPNANNGTLTNAPARMDVQTFPPSGAGAIGMDGVDDYISTPTGVLNGLNNWTVEMWVKTDEDRVITGSTPRPFLLGNHFGGGSTGDFNLFTEGGFLGMHTGLGGGGGTFISTTRLSNHAWHHVAASCNGSLVRLFMDGVLLGSLTGTVNLATNVRPFWVGNLNPLPTGYSHGGTFDEIRFSNTARYTATFTPPGSTFTTDANTVLLWHLDQSPCSTASTTPDASGNNHDGTFFGNPTRAISDVPLQNICTNLPTANAGPDQTTCILAGNETVQLAATIGGAATTAIWTGGLGTFSPNANALNAIYTPTAGEIAAGGVTLTLTTNDPDDFGPCLAVNDQVALNLNSIDAGVITGGETICAGGNPVAFGQTTAPTGSAASLAIVWQKSTTNCSTGFSDISGANSAIYDPPNGLATTTYFRRKVSSTFGGATCVDFSNCLTVNVLANPTASIQSSVTVVCNGNLGSFTIAGSGGMGPYQFAICAGGGCSNFGTNQPTGLFENLAPNAYTFRVTDANGCTATISGTVVQFMANLVSSSQPLCFGGTDGDATLSTTNGTGPFTFNLGGGNSNSTGVFTNVLAAGNYTATVTDANNCQTNLAFSIGQPPVLGGSATVTHLVDCTGPNTGHILAAGSGGTGPFEFKIDGGPFQPSANFNSVAVGSHVLTIRDAHLCLATASFLMGEYEIGIDGDPIICTGTSTMLTATANFSATAWLWTDGPTTQSITVSPTVPTTYTVTITAPENCEMVTSFEVTPTPAGADAGPEDVSFCVSPVPQIQLAGSIYGVATEGTWTGGAGSYSPDNQTLNAIYTPTAGELSAPSLTLTLTTDDPDGNGPCEAASDNVLYFFSQIPTTATAGPDQVVCDDFSATLAGNVPVIGSGSWFVISGPSLDENQFSNVTHPGASFTPGGGPGVYVLEWHITQGPCPSSFDQVEITAAGPPSTAYAGPNQEVCSNGPAFLAANPPTAGNGLWSIVSGPSLLLSQFSQLTNPFSLFTQAGGAGVYILKWTTGNPPCPSSESTVSIEFIDPPSNSNAGPDQVVCISENATLAANLPNSGVGEWSVLSGPSLDLAQFSNENSPVSTFMPAGGGGTYVLEWTISNPPCPASSTTVSITVNAETVAGAVVSNQEICSGNAPALLSLTGATGAVLKWQSSANFFDWDDIANTTTTYQPGPLTAAMLYRAVVQSGLCAEGISAHATIDVLENVTPTASVGFWPNTTVCEGMTVEFYANYTFGTPTSIFHWMKNGQPVGDDTDFYSTDDLEDGDLISFEMISDFPCAMPQTVLSDVVEMTVNAQPCAAIGQLGPLCTTDLPEELYGFPEGGTGTFSGPGVFYIEPPIAIWFFDPNAAGSGTHTIIYEYDFGGGVIATAEQEVVVEICVVCEVVATISPTNPPPVCSPETVVLTADPNDSAFDYQWKKDGTPISGATSPTFTATMSGDYSVVIVETETGCTDESGAVTVSILPLPEVSLSAQPPVCIDPETTIFLTGGSPAGGVYSGSGVSPPDEFNSGDAGIGTHIITYTVTGENGCMASSSRPKTVHALPEMFVLTGGGSICAGATGLPFDLSDSEIGVNYQLKRDGNSVGSPLSGTGNALNFGLQTVAGFYGVVATNTATGCMKSMSGNPELVVHPLPTLFNLTGGGSYCLNGGGLPIDLSGTQTDVFYQLKRDGSPVGPPVLGLGSPISFGSQTVAGTYSVEATSDAGGCVSQMTGSPVIVVLPLPNDFLVTGGGNVCAGNSGEPVGLNDSEGGVNYQLLRDGSPVGSPVAGTGVLLNFGNQNIDGIYTVEATNIANGCTKMMIGSAEINLNPLPVLFTVTGGGSFCAGGAGLPIGLSGSETGANYQLKKDGSDVGAPVPGNGTPLNFGNQTAAGIYTVLAANANCQVLMTGSPAIVVNPLPVAFAVTGGGPYCADGAGLAVGLAGSQNGVNYQLKKDGSPVGSPISGNGNALDFGLQTMAGSYSVVATNAATGCTNSMTGAVSIVVNPLPTAFAVTGGGSYCAGGAGLPVGLLGSQIGVNYQLRKDGSPVGPPVSGTGNALAFGNQTAAGNYTVVATNASTGCTKLMNDNALISINPLPTAFNLTGGGAYCAGGTGLSVGLADSENGIDYQLKRDGSPVGSPVSGNGNALDFGLQTVAGSYSIVATNVSTGCTNSMTGAVSIVVNPLPTAFAVTGGGAFCAGGVGLSVGLANSQTGIDYQLKKDGSPIGSPISGNGNALDFGLQTAAGSYSVVATNAATGCTNSMTGAVLIVVNPLPTAFAVTGGGAFCAGGAGLPVGLLGSNLGVNYQLQKDGSPVGAPLAGTGGALAFGNQTVAGNYTVVATNAATGCTKLMNDNALISINTLPTAFNLTGGGAYCAGGTGLPVGLAGSQTGVNYQLKKDGSPVGSPVSGTGNALNFGNQTAAGSYSVMATNGATGCMNAMTGAVSIVVNPLPVVTLANFATVATTTPPFLLSGGLPTGGVFSGPGVSAGMFNPSVAGVGTHSILYTFTDGNGCMASASKPITVVLQVICPLDRNVNLNPACKLHVPNLVPEVVIAPGYSASSITQNPGPGNVNGAHNMVVPVTITIVLTNGETVICTVLLTGKDVTPPKFIPVPLPPPLPPIPACPPGIAYANMSLDCKIAWSNVAGFMLASDNCGTVTVTQVPAAGGTPFPTTHNQSYTITVIATDAAGNTATCIRTMKARDVTKPTATCPVITTPVPLTAACKMVIPNLVPQVVATDGCTMPLTITQNPTAGTQQNSAPGQIHLVTITVKDGANNAQTCTVSLTAGACAVMLVGKNDRETEAEIFAIRSKKVEEKPLDLQTMPNPFSDELTIVFDLVELGKTRLVLMDITGKFTFLERERELEAGRQKVVWNTEDLPDGVYLVGLKTESAGWIWRKAVLSD